MIKISRSGSVEWSGGIQDGRGAVSAQSGALRSHPYGFHSRFGETAGTNPEELLGAAHAACYTMALALQLEGAGYVARLIETVSEVTLSGEDEGFRIARIALSITAQIPDCTGAIIQRLAFEAMLACPISRLVRVDVELTARLLAPA